MIVINYNPLSKINPYYVYINKGIKSMMRIGMFVQSHKISPYKIFFKSKFTLEKPWRYHLVKWSKLVLSVMVKSDLWTLYRMQ